MDNSAFLTIGIVGTAITLLTQYLKTKFGGGPKTLAILAGLSIIGGTIYFFLQSHVAIWQAVLAILASATLVYNFALQFLEKKD